jgi:hypothetical protein
MTTSYKINLIKKKLFAMRFINELEDVNKKIEECAVIDINELVERKKKLETIVREVNQVRVEKEVSNRYNPEEFEIYAYKKKWTSLQPYHKLIKIEEYIKTHTTDENKIKEIMKEMTEKIYNGTKFKKLKYDSSKMKIEEFEELII